MKTFLFELNEAARQSRNVLTTKQLKDTALELQAAVLNLNASITTANMRVVNGLWARGVLLISRVAEEGEHPPGGSTGSDVLMQAVA